MNLNNACSFNLSALSIDCDVKTTIGIDSVVLCNVDDLLPYETPVSASAGYADTSLIHAFGNQASGFGLVDLRSTPFEGSSKTTSEGTVAPSTTKTLQFLYFVPSYVEAKTLEELRRGKFVAVVKHSGAGTGPGQKFELIGYEVPLRLTACEKQMAAADTNGANYGAYLVTLSTVEMTDNLYFGVASTADYAAELAAYEALGAH